MKITKFRNINLIKHLRWRLWITFLLVTACKVDYLVQAEYIYINETQYAIEVIASESFVLNPGEEHTMGRAGTGGKNTTSDSYVPPFDQAFIIFDSLWCSSLSGGYKAGPDSGICGIQHYSNRKRGERYYEFTYVFTEEDFMKAQLCN